MTATGARPRNVNVAADIARSRRISSSSTTTSGCATCCAGYLTEQGFRVTIADDAADARAKLAGLAFDLLVLDIMMPGENGLDLTRSLRAEERGADPAADRHGRARRPHHRPGERRRRLSGQALRAARAGAAHPRHPDARVPASARATARARSASAPSSSTSTAAACSRAASRSTSDRAPRPICWPAGAPRRRAAVSREALARRRDQRARAAGRRAGDAAAAQDRRPTPRFPRYLQTVRGRGYMLQPD